MKQLTRFRILLLVSLILTVSLPALMLLNRVYRFNADDIGILLFWTIAFAPNLLHVYVSNSLTKKYFPQEDIPRSFIIRLHIVSVLAWIVCAGMFFFLISIVITLINRTNDFGIRSGMDFSILISFLLLVCIMPFQYMGAYKLVSTIQENHKNSLLNSFN